ncbi:tyrosine-type recombinase/integrase [Sphingomonas xanthus]|uniref:Site-specific integrase n=1 Tax=Sphingomonas xanthus TaxID=2594473 RepID=A0A516IP65_9SPHN|nr:site-specific integrase [Sphingomonas xanthus]QDP18702.1 site-specific integrase [Sphingomonas xanthus]
MPTGKITKRSVDAFQAGAKDAFLWDDELKGFGLRLTAMGARSYVLQYRMGGRETPSRRYTIGSHGSPWTPDAARKEAIRLITLVRQGIDPVEADKVRRRQAVELAFDDYVDAFTKNYLKKRWKQWQLGSGVLRREAIPVLRNKPLPKIARSDLNPIWDRLMDRPAVARLTHATLRKLFRWAISRGDLERSPMEGMEAPPPVPARDRALSDEELGIAFLNLDRLGKPFEPYFKLLIFTAQRREEVARMAWSELDRPKREWILPAARTKNSKAHQLPLSLPAIKVLDELAGGSAWPRSGLVFTTTGESPISGFSKAKKRLDSLMAAAIGDRYTHWRAHDIRRTVATGLQRLGTRLEVTEAVLNHVSGSRSGIVGVYQTYNWEPEKRAALNEWAKHVLRCTASQRSAAG